MHGELGRSLLDEEHQVSSSSGIVRSSRARAFFLELEEGVGHAQLVLEHLILLGDREQLTVLVVELGLPTRGSWREPRRSIGAELLPPREQVRAIDALLAQERFERTAFPAGERGIGGVDQSQLLRGREPAPGARGHGFLGSTARGLPVLGRRLRGC